MESEKLKKLRLRGLTPAGDHLFSVGELIDAIKKEVFAEMWDLEMPDRPMPFLTPEMFGAVKDKKREVSVKRITKTRAEVQEWACNTECDLDETHGIEAFLDFLYGDN